VRKRKTTARLTKYTTEVNGKIPFVKGRNLSITENHLTTTRSTVLLIKDGKSHTRSIKSTTAKVVTAEMTWFSVRDDMKTPTAINAAPRRIIPTIFPEICAKSRLFPEIARRAEKFIRQEQRKVPA
jgi:hypothetical protein